MKMVRLSEALFAWSMVLSAGTGVALLLVVPEIVLVGLGHPMLTGTIHLLTLGGLLSGIYLTQIRVWPMLYGADAVWHWPSPVIWFFHGPGLAVFVWGLAIHDTWITYVGGHYMLPTGIVLSFLHGLRAAWRRSPGTPRLLAAHLPGLGLVLAMSLGSLLVMDAETNQYDVYAPDTIFLHLFAGGFLFFLPHLLLLNAISPTLENPGAQIKDGALLRWYGLTAMGGSGVFLAALALAPEGMGSALPLGLALPGAMLIWLGSPERHRSDDGAGIQTTGNQTTGEREGRRSIWYDAPKRVGRWVLGLLMLYAAIRLWRGAAPVELLHWLRLGVPFFLCGFALPELAASILKTQDPRKDGAAHQKPWAVLVAGALILLVGQHIQAPIPVQVGAALWLGGWMWMSVSLLYIRSRN